MELSFSHILMSVKFELPVMNRTVDVKYACYIMHSFAIFVLEVICHFWSSSLDMLLVRMRNSYGKSFICSTGHVTVQMNMHVHI